MTGSATSWSSPQPWGDTVVFELYRITTPDAGAELRVEKPLFGIDFEIPLFRRSFKPDTGFMLAD